MDTPEPFADTCREEDRVMSWVAGGVGFVHLRVHSAYSLLEGALPIKRLAELAAADRMPALGIADTGNLFGALEFAEKMAEKGIQPIVGCQVAVDFGDAADEGRPGQQRHRPLADIVLIAASEAGYWNLVRLVSDSFMRVEPSDRALCRHRRPCRVERRADRADRRPRRPHRPGDRRRADGPRRRAPRPAGRDLRRPALRRGAAPRHRAGRGRSCRVLVDLAYARGLPLVATNEPFFPAREDYEAHDALIAIAEGAVVADGNRRRLTAEHYFKTRAEMAALFADLPEAIENTVEIAMRCAWWPRTRKPILPRFAETTADAATAEKAEAEMLRDGRPRGAGAAARRPRPRARPDRSRLHASASTTSSASSRA